MKKGPVEFIFVIDKSAAMRGREDVVVSEFNAMLREQQDMEGEALITTVLFDDRYELFHDRIDIHAAAPLSKEDCKAQGKAALFDAIGKSMHKFRRVRHGTREDCRGERTVFIIITGSGDRASRGYTEEMVRKRIAYRRKRYGWEFVFFGTSMDAAAVARKIGIAAEMAQDCSADAEGIRTAYTAASSLLTAYRRDEGAGEPGSSIAERAADNVLSKFRAEKEGISFTIEGILRASYEQKEDSAMEVLHAHLGDRIVITGTWAEAEGERELEEEELFEWEISASVFTIGCYAVRIAECLYVDDIGSGTHYTQRVPAGRDRITGYRVSHAEQARAWDAGYCIASGIEPERDRGVRIVTEVSAMNQSEGGGAADYWQNICMAALSRGSSWSERIDYICTVKKDDTVPDGQAVLFVLSRYMGSSYTSEDWYKFTPDGRVGKYHISGYGQNDTDVWEL